MINYRLDEAATLVRNYADIWELGQREEWRRNEWFQNAGNVQFFAPKLTELAAELGDDIRVNLERVQISAYTKAHPELKVFMEEQI